MHQQLCRLLLLSLDRLRGGELAMTQEMIAKIVGMRHAGLSEAAVKLRKARLIHYVRGHISVLDRARLEARNCVCCAAVKKAYERLLRNRMVT